MGGACGPLSSTSHDASSFGGEPETSILKLRIFRPKPLWTNRKRSRLPKVFELKVA
jgi:hypothetical protein